MKKAQIHMLETIAVLVIFFILFFLGFIFYVKVSRSSLEAESEENAQLLAIEIAQRASLLPELQCSEENIVTSNCIDLIKLESAPQAIQKNEVHYYDKLLFSEVTIDKIYPDKFKWTLYERPLEKYSNKFVTNIPIALYNPITKTNAFGVMNVTVYLK